MTSTRQKGNQSQVVVRKFYEADGWKMHNQGSQWRRIHGRWIPVGNDIWGAFDLIGLHAEFGFLFVQSKTGGSGIQEAKRRIESLPWPKNNTGLALPHFDMRTRVVVAIVKKHSRRGRPYGTYLRILRWDGTAWNVETVELSKRSGEA